jgi:ATP-dependent DNA helicase RecG
MKAHKATELLDLLNQTDECNWIEAKGGSGSSRSFLETVCALSNEPGMQGGYILLGVRRSEVGPEMRYSTSNIKDPDKAQSDIASQCASVFNIPVRPEITVETIDGNTILKVMVFELDRTQKPLYFKADGLPRGAYRRIGPTDQRCSDDDMRVFFSDTKSMDQLTIESTSIEDVDKNAIQRYRSLRMKVNPYAEELQYSDVELLQSLGCLSDNGPLTMAGVLVFGNARTLRSKLPAVRIDYIRIPGNKWIENPDERFSTIDMRGPLLLILFRVMEAVNADLPKGFALSDDKLQASHTGLPGRVLREAVVNALIHRSYREHQPIQVIRYDNRIEIINPGFSLKSPEALGEPGSVIRNPFIASIFHETNLAETKGSGIRVMRKLMAQADLAMPTFDSDRSKNQFTTRLLLHHFLNQQDLEWLRLFDSHQLNDRQKRAMIFVREVGAIDNSTYRQLSDCDVLEASKDLSGLKSLKFLQSKGKGKATYYIPGKAFPVQKTPAFGQKTPAPVQKTPAPGQKTPAPEIMRKIEALGKKVQDLQSIKDIISEICANEAYSAAELANIFGRKEKYFKRKYLAPMIKEGKIQYKYPEMPNHPNQAYKAG